MEIEILFGLILETLCINVDLKKERTIKFENNSLLLFSGQVEGIYLENMM